MGTQCGESIVLFKHSNTCLYRVNCFTRAVHTGLLLLACAGFAGVASTNSETISVSESNQNVDNQLQSLLLLIDGAGLQIERRIAQQPLKQNRKNQNSKKARTLADEQSRLRAAIRLGSGKIPLRNQTAMEQLSRSQPSARWYSETGELLTVTNFVDPRVLRAPQSGSLVHGAIVAKTTARFLIRGPLDAVSIEVYLPDISDTIEVRPTPLVRVNPRAETTTDDSAATALIEQSWRFDL